jgi:lactate dehydrogenase-like 2-hydroxyacid dehydrogenase
MENKKQFRVFATSRIGDLAENRLRKQGYELEVFQGPEAPPKKLIIEKVKSGIDGLITTLRHPIDAEVFEAGKRTLKVVAQIAVGFDNINRADANKYTIPFTNTADVLTEATAEFPFFMMGMPPSRCRSAGIRLTTSGHVDTNFEGMTNDSAPAFGVRQSATRRIRRGELEAALEARPC